MSLRRSVHGLAETTSAARIVQLQGPSTFVWTATQLTVWSSFCSRILALRQRVPQPVDADSAGAIADEADTKAGRIAPSDINTPVSSTGFS